MRRTKALAIGAMVTCLIVGFSSSVTATAQAKEIIWNTGGNPPPEPELGSFKTLLYTANAIIECKRDRWNRREGWHYFECVVIAWKINPNGKSNNVACTSPAAASGEIVTNSLTLTYAAIDSKTSRVGAELKPKGLFTTFECDGVKFEAKGGVIGEITPLETLVTPPESYTLNFARSAGHQAVTKFQGGKTTELEFSATEGTKKGKYKAGAIESIEELSFEVPTELRPAKKGK
jgi:hypothetical protein